MVTGKPCSASSSGELGHLLGEQVPEGALGALSTREKSWCGAAGSYGVLVSYAPSRPRGSVEQSWEQNRKLNRGEEVGIQDQARKLNRKAPEIRVNPGTKPVA